MSDDAATGSDSGSESTPDTEPDADTEPEAGSGTEAKPGTTPDAESESTPDATVDPDATAAAKSESLVWQKVRSVFEFEHSHSPGTKLLVLALGVVVGLFASWLLADLGGRTISFLLFTAAGTYALYARPTRRDVLIRGLYSLALLLVLTPVMLNVTFLLADYGTGGITDPWRFVFTAADLLFLVVFSVFAAVPAGIAFLLDRRR